MFLKFSNGLNVYSIVLKHFAGTSGGNLKRNELSIVWAKLFKYHRKTNVPSDVNFMKDLGLIVPFFVIANIVFGIWFALSNKAKTKSDRENEQRLNLEIERWKISATEEFIRRVDFERQLDQFSATLRDIKSEIEAMRKRIDNVYESRK